VYCPPTYVHSLLVLLYSFFFSSRRRHTRSKRDWSSDVCFPISITSFTSSNVHSGTDTASATVTIDNQSPGVVTSASATPGTGQRSEERRVGKECRSRRESRH